MLSTAAADGDDAGQRKLSASSRTSSTCVGAGGLTDASWPQMMALIFLFSNQLGGSDYL